MTWITSFLLSVKGFFLKNKYAVIVTGAALILLWIILLQKRVIDRKNKEIAVAAHNLAAANDAIRITKDNAGKVEFDKLSYLFEKVSNLEKANKELAQEVRETKGKVSQITQIGFKIIRDTVKLETKTEITDTTIKSEFNFDSSYTPGNYRLLKGFTTYNFKTKITIGLLTKDEIGVKLVTGIKNLDQGKPEIFVRSDFPGFVVTQLEGAVLDPNLFSRPNTKPVPLVTLGATVGWTPITYDWNKKVYDFNIQRVGVTAGLSFNLVKLLK